MSDDPERDKEEALKRIADVPRQCDELDTLARGLLKASSEARDTAAFDAVVIRVLPADAPGAAQYFQNATKRWETFGNAAGQVAKIGIYGLPPFTAVVSGTMSTASLGAVDVIQWPRLKPQDREEIKRADERLKQKHDLSQVVADIEIELAKLRLDVGPESQETPAQLLKSAYHAVQYPVSAEAAKSPALITMRTAINNSIAELIRHRKNQEPAGSREEKILSLGRNAGRLGLPADRFAGLASDYHALNKELSGEGKKANHEEVEALFYRAALFFRAFLQALDETKLRTASD